MARTEREKQNELLGMIRRDFTPQAPKLELVLEQTPPDSDDEEDPSDDGSKEAWENYLNRD